MYWPNSTFFGRVEVECWGAGAEGSGYAKARVSVTARSDVELE